MTRCKTGKKQYHDLIAVKLAFSRRAETEMRYYKCNLCKKYHLTSQTQRTIPRSGE